MFGIFRHFYAALGPPNNRCAPVESKMAKLTLMYRLCGSSRISAGLKGVKCHLPRYKRRYWPQVIRDRVGDSWGKCEVQYLTEHC